MDPVIILRMEIVNCLDFTNDAERIGLDLSQIIQNIDKISTLKEIIKRIGNLIKLYPSNKSIILIMANLTIKQKFSNTFNIKLPELLEYFYSIWIGKRQFEKLEIEDYLLIMSNTLEWDSTYNLLYKTTILRIIENEIRSTESGSFEEPILPRLVAHLSTKFIPFYSKCFGDKYSSIILEKSMIEMLNLSISTVRSLELFPMILDFPDSLPAIRELGACCEASGTFPLLAQAFQDSICKRLLHSGASTNTILQIFISIIKALRTFEPSDAILDLVSLPIRRYLLTRKDLTRCIVVSLTEGKDSPLHLELRKGSLLEYLYDENDEEAGPGVDWHPRRRLPGLDSLIGHSSFGIGSQASLLSASSSFSSSLLTSCRHQDTLSILVSILGSPSALVNEYRGLLAERLLSNWTFQTDESVATLELLKIRFGEESLHSCEVMVHDIEQARRTNHKIDELRRKKRRGHQLPEKPDFPIEYFIISSNYWPSAQLADTAVLDDEEGDLLLDPPETCKHSCHPYLSSQLDEYHSAYSQTKNRILLPIQSMGRVELDLTFEEGGEEIIRSFKVHPIMAGLILHMSDLEASSPFVSLDTLSRLSELPPRAVRRHMRGWISRRVVQETRHPEHISNPHSGEPDPRVVGYRIINTGQRENLLWDEELSEREEAEHFEGQVQAQEAGQQSSEDRWVTQTLLGLLRNQAKEGMTLERVHFMLRHMSSASQGPGAEGGAANFSKNLVQLRSLLQSLVDQTVLECLDGQYQIRK